MTAQKLRQILFNVNQELTVEQLRRLLAEEEQFVKSMNKTKNLPPGGKEGCTKC